MEIERRNSSEMKIANVRLLAFSIPIEERLQWARPSGERQTQLTVPIVQVSTGEGITGIGQTYFTYPLPVYKALVEAWLRPLLIGEDPLDIDRLWEKMYGSVYGTARRGVAVQAMSGVDVALWDIKGKVMKAPLYQLLSGKHRSRLRAYASLLSSPRPGYDPTEDVMRYVDEGYAAVKFKVWKEAEVKFIKSVREAVGNDVDLMIDANCHYTRHLAHKVAKECERHDMFWLEEPYLPDDLEGVAELAAATGVNIAGAENEQTRYGFREIITRHAMDIIMPDICICGGISETVKIASMASTYHMPCDLHLAYRPTMEGLHVSTSIPNSLFVENVMAFTEPIIASGLIVGSSRVERGYVDVPSKPGLGVEIDEKVAARYAVKLQ